MGAVGRIGDGVDRLLLDVWPIEGNAAQRGLLSTGSKMHIAQLRRSDSMGLPESEQDRSSDVEQEGECFVALPSHSFSLGVESVQTVGSCSGRPGVFPGGWKLSSHPASAYTRVDGRRLRSLRKVRSSLAVLGRRAERDVTVTNTVNYRNTPDTKARRAPMKLSRRNSTFYGARVTTQEKA